ncbi:hypothetical protein HYX04_01375 [Candidatus Woesearchaeota archaeon]|nr:hypothetical protein [Candidatus Woesearchaeota archaeon]
MADNQEKPQAQDKKEEKPKAPTTLESAVDESWHAIKSSANNIVGAGAIAGATALFGLDGLVTAASFPIGARISSKLAGKEFSSSKFRDEAIAGALFTPPLWYGVEAVKQAPKALGLDGLVANILGTSIPISPFVVGGLALGVLTPALTALYYPLQYVIQNKTFKGIGKDFKENYWKGLKRALPLTTLTSTAIGATFALPYLAPYLFPALAVGSVLYRMLLSKEGKVEYKRLLYPSTYLPNVLNPFYLMSGAASVGGKLYRGVTKAAYDIGSAIRSVVGGLFKAAPSPAATTAPTPAPAH